VADNTTLPGTGDVIASDDIGGVKFQRVKVTYGADGSATDVSPVAGLPVQGVQDTRTTGTITSAASAVGPIAASNRNLVTVDISGTYAGVTFQIQGSPDGGTTWFPVSAMDNASGRAGTTWTPGTNAAASYDAAIGGFTHVRVQASAWTSGTANVGVTPQVFAYEPAVAAYTQQPARTQQAFYATAAAAGATGTETLITLTKSSGTAATTAASSFAITAGKTLRITAFSVATRGNATATTQTTTFNLRINTAGAITTTSTPVLLAARSATPATASAWDRVIIPVPDGFEIQGTGTLQWGLSAAATYTTNAPTWDVTILGYEY
jgi:hypothetical protein